MTGRLCWFLLALALLAPAAPLSAQPLIYVTRYDPVPRFSPNTWLSVINSATGHQVASTELGIIIPGEVGPGADVVVSPDGRTAYVSVLSHILCVDTATLTVTDRIQAGSDLRQLAISPDGSRLYAADLHRATVVTIDTASKQVDGEAIPTPGGAASLVVSPDGARLYVLSRESDAVSVVDLASRSIVGTITTGPVPKQMTVHPDGSRLYVVHRGSDPIVLAHEFWYGHQVTAYDTATLEQTGTVTLPGMLEPGTSETNFALVEGQPGRMSILPSGSRLYVPRSVATQPNWSTEFHRAERVDVIDTATLSIAAEIPLTTTAGGTTSTGIWSALSSDGSKLFVAGSGPAVAIDTTTHVQTPAGPGVEHPTGMAVAAAPPCWFEFGPGEYVATGPGLQQSFEIAAPSGCSWTATAPDEWIALSPSSGVGPGQLNLVVASSLEPRNGSFAVNGQARRIRQVIPTAAFDSPAEGSEVTLPFNIGGWGIVRDADVPGSGTGVTAYWLTHTAPGTPMVVPLPDPARGTRADVAAVFGERYAFSGFNLRVGRMAAGRYTVLLNLGGEAGGLSPASTTFTVRREPIVVIQAPAPGASVAQPFTFAGWAADMTVPTGTGVDTVHVWAYLRSGGSPVFLGATPSNRARFGIAALFNEPSLEPGFALIVNTLPPGQYTLVAYAHCTATNAFDVAASVDVSVDDPPPPVPPFGVVDTPAEGALVSGAMLMTGWALDDTEVTRVSIYRDPVAGEAARVFIGDATFVEGSRLDIVAFFQDYPRRTRAGWGLSILTNMLPDGGNGLFTFEAEAHDTLGNVASLGRRTVLVDNATSQMPFGTIDTPGQGATVSGTILNWAWALTPGTATIPADGSTIDVLIDNVVVGRPTRFGLNRADIAALFPGYTNTNSAVGYYVLDTTTLSNGIHTIAWVVRDDMGRARGIGSRYFFVENPATVQATVQHRSTR